MVLIEKLSAVDAEALVLQVLGHSIEEIARMTDTPIDTVRGRVRRAKLELRERIMREPNLVQLLEVRR